MILFANKAFCSSHLETKICLLPPLTLGALKMTAIIC